MFLLLFKRKRNLNILKQYAISVCVAGIEDYFSALFLKYNNIN